MDLIDRAAAIDAMKKWATQPVIMKSRHWNNLGKAITLDLIATVEEQPTIEAVPLDKLCAWLNKNQGELPPCPFDDDCYECGLDGIACIKKRIKAWMEGQHDNG